MEQNLILSVCTRSRVRRAIFQHPSLTIPEQQEAYTQSIQGGTLLKQQRCFERNKAINSCCVRRTGQQERSNHQIRKEYNDRSDTSFIKANAESISTKASQRNLNGSGSRTDTVRHLQFRTLSTRFVTVVVIRNIALNAVFFEYWLSIRETSLVFFIDITTRGML